MLLVPNFKFNLLSVKRLCEQLHSTVQFTENLCILQAPSLRRPVAIGKDHKGLYVLDKEVFERLGISKKSSAGHTMKEDSSSIQFYRCNSASSSVHFSVWHQRLGHMSCNKMKVVPNLVLTDNEMKNFVCEVYPKAKQHRLPFPVG